MNTPHTAPSATDTAQRNALRVDVPEERLRPASEALSPFLGDVPPITVRRWLE